MTIMEKDELEVFRVMKTDYTPKYDMAGKRGLPYSSNDPLLVHLYVSDDKGERYRVMIKNTRPRFWVRQNPATIDFGTDYELIDTWERSGTDIMGNPLWCIYVLWPWGVSILREHFKWHGRADIPYYRAVRYYHNIGSYIRLKRSELGEIISISDIENRPIPDIPSKPYYLKIMYFDVETDDVDYILQGKSTMPVVCISFVVFDEAYFLSSFKINNRVVQKRIEAEINDRFPDSKYSFDFFSVDSEKELYKLFTKLLGNIKPTAISGWNTDYFDIPYMERRADSRNRKGAGFLKPNFRPIVKFDLIDAYQKTIKGQLTRFGKDGLNAAAERLFNIGKVPREKIHDMLIKKKNTLAVYNLMDSILCAEIDKKLRMSNFFGRFADSCGVELTDAFKPTYMVESLLIRAYGDTNIVPTRSIAKRDEGRKRGGKVNSYAVPGVGEDVIVVDLTREYPSVMLSGNIDPSTKIRNSEDAKKYPHSTFPSGRMYRTDFIAPIPVKLLEQIEIRISVKKEIKLEEGKKNLDKEKIKLLKDVDATAKERINSIYGALGNDGFLYCDYDLMNDITEVARIHLGWNRRLIEEYSYELKNNPKKIRVTFIVIYSDTDSSFIKTISSRKLSEDELNEIGYAIEKMLNDSYPEFARTYMKVDKHYFSVKFEKLLKIFVQWEKMGAKKGEEPKTATKRYVFEPYHGDIVYMGLEAKRSDSSELTRRLQKEVFETFFKTRDKVATLKMVQNEIRNLKNKKIDMDTKTLEGVRVKGNDFYPHMMKSNRMYGKHFVVGDKIAWYHTLPKGNITVLEIDDNPKDFGIELDYDTIIDKQIKRKLTAILKALDIDARSLLDGIVKKTLF